MIYKDLVFEIEVKLSSEVLMTVKIHFFFLSPLGCISVYPGRVLPAARGNMLSP
jgi:hypothetical protein